MWFYQSFLWAENNTIFLWEVLSVEIFSIVNGFAWAVFPDAVTLQRI
jgi:hypothetical protein